MASKTRGGNGCIEVDLVQTLLTLFQSAFSRAARSSRDFALAPRPQGVSPGEDEVVAINHAAVKRLVKRIGSEVVAAIGEGDCISKTKVADLKARTAQLIDNPPPVPPGQALAQYKKFVESKYSQARDD